MSTWAIGDVHGCARTLDALLAALPGGAPLVFVGDYVDRGPDSPGVLDRLVALGQERPCVFLRGNHDQMLLDYVDGAMDAEELSLWTQQNGGDTTLRQYEQRGGIPRAHADFLRATQLFHEAEGAAFVHAGLDPYRRVDEQLAQPDAFALMWRRDHLDVLPSARAWERPVVCGHTPHAEPLDQPNLVLVDTGVFRPASVGFGRLTAVEMPQRRFVSVPNAD